MVLIAAMVLGTISSPPSAELGLAIGGESRRFTFNDPIGAILRNYEQGLVPTINMSLRARPLRWKRKSGQWRSLGLIVEGALGAPRPGSVVDEGVDVTLRPRAQGWAIGAEYRLDQAWGYLALLGNVGAKLFDFRLEPQRPALGRALPEVDYRRSSLLFEVGMRDGPLSPWGAFGIALVPESGALGRRFPNSEQGAVEAKLGLRRRVGQVSAELWGQYQHYYFTMNPLPGDEFVAGGGLDQYLGIFGGIRWRLQPPAEEEES